MKHKIREIKPGIGLGEIKFGMTRKQIKAILGEPEEIEKFSYSNIEEDLTESWEYYGLALTLGFDEEDNWRLGMISVSSSFYTLLEKELIGLNQKAVIDFIKNNKLGEVKIEDLSSVENPNHILIDTQDRMMNFWFDDGILGEIQWSPEYIDDNTIEWPE